MTEPNEFGDRWCCEPCKRLAEAAADETLAAAKLANASDLGTAVIMPRVNVRRPWQPTKGKADRG